MKKNLIYLVVFLVLLALAGWLMSQRSTGATLEGKENYAFTIEDTAAVNKIIISTKKPSTVTLVKRPNGWFVNDQIPAREVAISTLLSTLKNMELRNFVPAKMQSTIANQLATSGKKVEIYKNGRLFKTLFVGTETTDQLGTYMMLKNGDAPYAVYIPGFNGFLNTRFITEPTVWQRRDLINIKPRNIKEVVLTYPDSVEASFTLRVFSPDSAYAISAATGESLKNFNQNRARLFLAAFNNLRYEGAVVPEDGIYKRRDSLLASTPVFKIEVKDIDGKRTMVKGFHIKNAYEAIVPGEPETYYDPDRLHGFIDDERMVLMQYYGLRNVLVSPEFFKNNR